MGICSYFTYSVLIGIIAKKLATLIAIIVAVIIYVLAIVALRVFFQRRKFYSYLVVTKYMEF